jgi:hypothetical protein
MLDWPKKEAKKKGNKNRKGKKQVANGTLKPMQK